MHTQVAGAAVGPQGGRAPTRRAVRSSTVPLSDSSLLSEKTAGLWGFRTKRELRALLRHRRARLMGVDTSQARTEAARLDASLHRFRKRGPSLAMEATMRKEYMDRFPPNGGRTSSEESISSSDSENSRKQARKVYRETRRAVFPQSTR